MNRTARAIFAQSAALGAALTLGGMPARASLPAAQRAVLQRYVGALSAGRYEVAFASLAAEERRYFGTVANFRSAYAADRLKIDGYTIVGSTSDRLGTVAIVSERVDFLDQAHQSQGKATAKVAYGILKERGAYVIKDPYHPWRALAPAGLEASSKGVRVVVRKLSFFTGRLELVATFENAGDRGVTLLPYGRTVLRDQSGKTYAPIASKLAALTDKTLYTGLVLPASGRYTGLMTFLTPDRFTPASLTLTIAPALFEGGDAPFSIVLPPYVVPK